MEKPMTDVEKKQINDYYRQIDIDLSGMIELTEWIVASIDKRSLI